MKLIKSKKYLPVDTLLKRCQDARKEFGSDSEQYEKQFALLKKRAERETAVQQFRHAHIRRVA